MKKLGNSQFVPLRHGRGYRKLAKTPIDELVRAIETISYLSDAVAENEESIVAIEKRIDKIEAMLHELVEIIDAINRSG